MEPLLDGATVFALRQAKHDNRDTFPEVKGKQGNSELFRASELVYFWRNRTNKRKKNAG